MAVLVAVGTSPVSGAPADLFSNHAAPVVGKDPPKATDLRAGDATVSTQTGNLSYVFPITVPPGRAGAQPRLSLTYSSTAPVYGGIAAGWTIGGVPGVFLDLSQGRMRTQHPLAELLKSAYERKADDRFTSSLVGGHRLVLVDEPKDLTVWGTYRSRYDHTYTRFDRMSCAPRS